MKNARAMRQGAVSVRACTAVLGAVSSRVLTARKAWIPARHRGGGRPAAITYDELSEAASTKGIYRTAEWFALVEHGLLVTAQEASELERVFCLPAGELVAQVVALDQPTLARAVLVTGFMAREAVVADTLRFSARTALARARALRRKAVAILRCAQEP